MKEREREKSAALQHLRNASWPADIGIGQYKEAFCIGSACVGAFRVSIRPTVPRFSFSSRQKFLPYTFLFNCRYNWRYNFPNSYFRRDRSNFFNAKDD